MRLTFQDAECELKLKIKGWNLIISKDRAQEQKKKQIPSQSIPESNGSSTELQQLGKSET